MRALAEYLAASWQLSPLGRELLSAGLILLTAIVVFAVALLIAALLTWLERRVAGRVQSRVGPNRVGPLGLLQWLADGLKMILKEDVVPAAADRPLFLLAPYPVMIGVFAAFATVPFSQLLIAADLDVGVLYLIAVTSLVVVGILMAGWGSNNKWSLLGGIRSAAQIVAYEVPAALALLSVVVMAGTLSLQSIVAAQGGWPWEWYLLRTPFGFVAFFIYFTAAVAEGNRTPFDLPEAESELVAGYNTEYSGIRFGGFFLGEFANIYLMSAIASALFFGGWQIPGVTPAEQVGSVWWQALGFLVFVAKAGVGCLVVILLRWTFPRLRVDQLTALCYRYLAPGAFLCLVGNALWIVLVPAGSLFERMVGYGMTAVAAALGLWFVLRMRRHMVSTGDRLDLDLFARGHTRAAFDPAWQARAYGRFRRRRPGEAS
ncbi:MAG: NADH-quinone oxidoreductase subunit NuoH [Myxococcales bacterium]|nr:NADH-quinone oxidoreductase subunit NuoH [Myxococcales bacterium]